MERDNSCSFHRTTDWLSLGGTFEGDLIQPLAQAGTHRTNTHDLLQMPFEYLHKRDPTTSLGTLCHCSVTLTVKKCCLMFRVNSLCFIFFPLPLVPSLGSTEKSLACVFVALSHLVDGIPLSLLLSRMISPSSPGIFLQESCCCHLCGPLLDYLQCVHVSLVLGCPELIPALQM